MCVLAAPFTSNILHPDLFLPICSSIGYISSTLHFYLIHWMTGNLAESYNNCTQRKKTLADEIGAVITLTITCQALRFNLRVHQFSEEEIKGKEEKQCR